ncbi:MAG: hypothetical protein AAGH83_06910 [Pseudomonadota bacterium]
MLYLISLLLPPVGILLAGRPFVAIVTFFVWLPAVIVTFGGAHLLFVALAWILIFQSHADRRAARQLQTMRDD